MEHTKLPWKKEPHKYPNRLISTQVHGTKEDNCGFAIADFHGPDAEDNLAFAIAACNAFGDIEEGVSMIVEKNHYYQLEAQAKSQPDLLAVCVRAEHVLDSIPPEILVPPWDNWTIQVIAELRAEIKKAGK